MRSLALFLNFSKNELTAVETNTYNEYDSDYNPTGRVLNSDKLFVEDIKIRNLPNQTSGLVITNIENDSPLKNSIEVNSIILEAQKKKIRNVNDLNQSIEQVLSSNQKTILLVIYNSENQRRYIGIKLD